jgi:hypothetical protein
MYILIFSTVTVAFQFVLLFFCNHEPQTVQLNVFHLFRAA